MSDPVKVLLEACDLAEREGYHYTETEALARALRVLVEASRRGPGLPCRVCCETQIHYTGCWLGNALAAAAKEVEKP